MAQKKKKYDDILRNLIKPDKDPEKITGNKIEKALEENQNFHITPKGILVMALAQIFGDDIIADMDKIDEFQRSLLAGLSTLSTNGETPELFGEDFNEFYSMYIQTMNLCGRMREAIEKNGIEFDFGDEQDEGENNDD